MRKSKDFEFFILFYTFKKDSSRKTLKRSFSYKEKLNLFLDCESCNFSTVLYVFFSGAVVLCYFFSNFWIKSYQNIKNLKVYLFYICL